MAELKVRLFSSTTAPDDLKPRLRLHAIRSTQERNKLTKPQQEAGIPRKLAPTIGISVDPRRQTTNQEALTQNVARLKDYKARLILFPRKSGQHKKLDSSESDVKMIHEEEGKIVRKLSKGVAVNPGTGLEFGFTEIKSGDMPKGNENAYAELRRARSDARYVGVREKREKLKAEAEDAKKK